MIGFPISAQRSRIPTDSTAINNMQNALEILRGLTFDKNQFIVKVSNNCMYVTLLPQDASDSEIANFKCTLDGSTVKVSAGNIKLHGIGSYRVAETDITLTGSPDWIFVWHNRDHTASGIDHMVTPDLTGPESDTNVLRIPLVKCEFSNGIYTITERAYKYDVQIDAPIR